VQQSGADGALGYLKFSLSNGYSIYLHDTPSRGQIRKPVRALSSGCVRLEKPRDLALLLLDDPRLWSAEALDAAIASGRTQTVAVDRQVPVMLLYRTAVADATGAVSFRSDIYNHDGAVLALLDATTPPPARRHHAAATLNAGRQPRRSGPVPMTVQVAGATQGSPFCRVQEKDRGSSDAG